MVIDRSIDLYIHMQMVKLELEALGFEVDFATVEVRFVLCVFTAGMCVCV